MPEIKAEDYIVRILDQKQVPVGAGCLISSRFILTCAHVVQKLDKEIEFSFLEFPQKKYKASKTNLVPSVEELTFGSNNDIAVLELLQDKASQIVVSSGPEYDFKNPRNCSVRVCGFPKDLNKGDWAYGKIIGSIGDGLEQFDNAAESKCVAPGFSGAPVWEMHTDAFVGMVVSTGKRKKMTSAYMISASTLAKAWPELVSKAEDTSETKSTVGRFVHKMCNREEQVDAFDDFFDEYKDNITTEQKPPQIYIIHGREDECHNSLVERFQYEKIKQFNKITFNDSVKPLLEKLPFEFDGDLEARKKRLSRKLFKLFDMNYPGSDFSNSSFRDFCIDKGLNKHRIIILSQDIVASKWDEDFRKLIEWYINDFWAGFKSSEDTPQFLIFLNVKYAAGDKPGMFKTLFKAKNTNKKIAKSLVGIQELTQAPCIMLKELPRIIREHVEKWFSEHNINIGELERLEIIDKMFKKEKELCMAKVESELEIIVKAASAHEF